MKRKSLCVLVALVCLPAVYLVVSDGRQFSKKEVLAPISEFDTPLTQPLKPRVTKQVFERSAYDRWNEVIQSNISSEGRFIKVDYFGNRLEDEASHWTCVLDLFNKLIWEVKSSDGGWRDASHVYSWFEPDQNEFIGEPDLGHCYKLDCDTATYRKAFNDEKVCGLSSWRLPENFELASLDHETAYAPDIDVNYFPNTISGKYWSNNPARKNNEFGWVVDFKNGFPFVMSKRLNFHLRLVSEVNEPFD